MVDQPELPPAGEQTDPSLAAADAQTGFAPTYDAPGDYAGSLAHPLLCTLEMQPVHATLADHPTESEDGSAIRRTGTERDELPPVRSVTGAAELRVDGSAADEYREDSHDPTQDASGSHPDQG